MIQPNKTKSKPRVKSIGLSSEQVKEVEEDVEFVNNWNANRVIKGKKLNKGYQIPNDQPIYLEDLNKDRKEDEGINRGAFNKKNNNISLDPSFTEENGIPAHEFTHRFQKYTKQQKPKIYNDYIKFPIETLAPNVETYQSDPDEIHSELMRLRRNANFKPEQVITTDDVKDVDFKNYNFEAIKDKDTLIELLNSTADNTINTSIPIAKYGINLNNKTQVDMNNYNIKPKTKKVPKAWVGAAIAGVSAISGMISANKEKKAAEEAEKLAIRNNFDTAVREQDIYNNQFIQDNINDLPVYDIGGEINTNQSSTTGKYDTVGGDLLPISSNAEVVDGNTHNENQIDNSYGVTLSENGEPVANVEDKEVVVDNNLVFSDKLKTGGKTFANIAYKLNKKIGELEVKNKQLIKPNEKFANEKTIIGLKKANENLFAEQELVKTNTYGNEQETIDVIDGKVPIGANGLRIDNPNVDAENLNIEDSNSFINREELGNLGVLATDNISNVIMTSNAPKVNTPIYRRPSIFSTRVNINPQLANISQTIGNSNEIIRANTNNSSVARANITANNLRGIEATNTIYGQKQDIERQLRDKQQTEMTRVAETNSQLNEDYQSDVRESTLQKNSAYSKNVKNLMEDYQAVKENSLQKQYDDDVISYSLLDDPTGAKRQVFDRFGRPLSKAAQARIDREKLRMKQFNDNKIN